MFSRLKAMFICALLAGGAAALQAGGNGAFLMIPGHGSSGKNAYINVYLDCYTEYNYVCGLTSVEVDWDDGSAFDSYVGYTPINEAEFAHEYYENGLYHWKVSADDDLGNWIDGGGDFYIS
jgi:hypothetical protein